MPNPNSYGFQFDFSRMQQPQTQNPATSMGGGGYGGGSAPPSMQFNSNAEANTYGQQSARIQEANSQAEKMLRLQQQGQRDLQQAQFNQQNAMRDSILGSLSAVGTWGTNAPPMPRINVQQLPMQGGVPQVSHVVAPDFTAAQNAAFARAKDREGQLAQGALTGLRSSLGGRGLLGSGAEFRGTANIVNKALGNLGEVNREQAIQNAAGAVDQMKMGYQGDITQRGQDITQAQNMNQNNLALAQMQFNADMAEREAIMRHNESGQNFMQNLLLGLVRAY